MALLIGEYGQTVDAKHRLAIPAALREQIDPNEDGKGFISVLGPDRHLWLYPEKYYRRLLATLKPSPMPERMTSKTRLMFGTARPLRADSQGRVVLPDISLQRAAVGEQVMLVGVFDHIEIWPNGEWEQYVKQELPKYGDASNESGDQAGGQGPQK